MSFIEDARWFTAAPAAGAPGMPTPPGRVTLVGAGPGDPELLTLRAVKALRGARLVLYDHLVGKEVLRYVAEDADLIYVGKESSHHTLPQESIIDLMVRLARSGRNLVRLKGGDGFIFGRGGEEAQALAEAGIAFDVVPGITAAQGAGACAGIPLTHRDHAATLVFATGHLRGDNEVALDWEALARPRQTSVPAAQLAPWRSSVSTALLAPLGFRPLRAPPSTTRAATPSGPRPSLSLPSPVFHRKWPLRVAVRTNRKS